MSRITIQDVYVAPEVDLWGHVFEVKPFTKHLEETLGDLPEKVRERLNDVKQGDDLVAVLGDYFDVMLKRTQAANGKRQSKPSTLLKQKWGSSQLSMEQLMRFFYLVHEDTGGYEVPPTSPQDDEPSS